MKRRSCANCGKLLAPYTVRFCRDCYNGMKRDGIIDGKGQQGEPERYATEWRYDAQGNMTREIGAR